MGITLPSILLWLLHRDDERYKEQPAWMKNLTWTLGWMGDIPILLPKPFVPGIVFGSIPERTLEWIARQDPAAFRGIGRALTEGLLPGFVPTAIAPIIENLSNYNFFRDRPIVPEGKKELLPEEQVADYTSATARLIGRGFDWSPAKIENWLQGWFGGMAQHGLAISDFLLRQLGLAEEFPEKPAPSPKEIPFVGAFVGRETLGSQSESYNRLYLRLETAERVSRTIKILRDRGEEERAAPHGKAQKGGENAYRRIVGLNNVHRADRLAR